MYIHVRKLLEAATHSVSVEGKDNLEESVLSFKLGPLGLVAGDFAC